MKAITLACFVFFLSCLVFSQATVSPKGHSPSSPEIYNALNSAHGLLASVHGEERVDALADLVAVAKKLNDPDAADWLAEFEQVVGQVEDDCTRARYQSRMIQLENTTDPKTALDRLLRTETTCPGALSPATSMVFPKVFSTCAGKCLSDILATAQHLGDLGSYPFIAIYALAQHSQMEAGDSNRVFLEAASAYKNANRVDWRAHRYFLELIQREQDVVQQSAIVDAVSVVITRIADAEKSDAGLNTVAISSTGATQMYSDRDQVLSMLYRIAASVDDRLGKEVAERWPNAPKVKIAAMKTGIVSGGNAPLPKDAKLFIEIQQAKGQASGLSVKDLQESALTAPAKVAMLAWSASEAFAKDDPSASSYLSAATDALDNLKDSLERVITSPYVVQAAMKCKDPNLALKVAERQFDTALPILRELQKQKPISLKDTPIYFPLRQTIQALGDVPMVMRSIQKVQDDELKARLLIAAGESLTHVQQ